MVIYLLVENLLAYEKEICTMQLYLLFFIVSFVYILSF